MSVSRIQSKMMKNILKPNSNDMDINNFRKVMSNKVNNTPKRNGYDKNKNKNLKMSTNINIKEIKNVKNFKLEEFAISSRQNAEKKEYNFDLSEAKLSSFVSSEKTNEVEEKVIIENRGNYKKKKETTMSLSIYGTKRKKSDRSFRSKSENSESPQNRFEKRNAYVFKKTPSIDGNSISNDSNMSRGKPINNKHQINRYEIAKKYSKSELTDPLKYEVDKKFKGINISIHKDNSIELFTINKLNLEPLEISNDEENGDIESIKLNTNRNNNSSYNENTFGDRSNKGGEKAKVVNPNEDYNINYEEFNGMSLIEGLEEEFPQIMKKLSDGIKDVGGNLVFDTSKILPIKNGKNNSNIGENDYTISQINIQSVKAGNPNQIMTDMIRSPADNVNKPVNNKNLKISVISNNDDNFNKISPLGAENRTSISKKAGTSNAFFKKSISYNSNSIRLKSPKDYSIYDVQKLSYDINNEYSHLKAPNDQNFLQRMEFYALKRQVKDLKMREMVGSRRSKIPEKEKLQTFNHLIEDANRRQRAQKKIESLNTVQGEIQRFNSKIHSTIDQFQINIYNDTGDYKKSTSKSKVSPHKWEAIYKQRFESKLNKKNERILEQKIKKEIQAKEAEEKLVEQIKSTSKKADREMIKSTVKRLYGETERKYFRTDTNNFKTERSAKSSKLYNTSGGFKSLTKIGSGIENEDKPPIMSNDLNGKNFYSNEGNNLKNKNSKNSPNNKQKLDTKVKKEKQINVIRRYNTHDSRRSINNLNASKSQIATGNLSPTSTGPFKAKTKFQSKTQLTCLNPNIEVINLDLDSDSRINNKNQPAKYNITNSTGKRYLTNHSLKPKNRKSNSIFSNKSYQSNINLMIDNKNSITDSPIKVYDLATGAHNYITSNYDTIKSTINTENPKLSRKKKSYIPDYKASFLVSNILNKKNGI